MHGGGCGWRRPPTSDEEQEEADDEEGRAAHGHAVGKVDEGREQQGSPEQEVEECPEASGRDDGGPGEAALLVVVLLEGVLWDRIARFMSKEEGYTSRRGLLHF